MKNVLVVSNYKAGRKKAVLHKKTLHKFLFSKGCKFRFIEIDKLDETDISIYDTLFAAGGDGTVNKAAVKIINSGSLDKTLCIIPCGTANLLAAKLGLSGSLKKTLGIIDKNTLKYIDALNINGRYSILRLGLGYDYSIISSAPQALKNLFGYSAYILSGIISAFMLKLKTYEITEDAGNRNINASCIIAANAGGMYKNLVSIAGNSEIDDGFFEVFLLKTANPALFFYECLKLIFGIRKNSACAEFFRTSNLKIKKTGILECHIDGETACFENEIDINILTKKIKVCACSI